MHQALVPRQNQSIRHRLKLASRRNLKDVFGCLIMQINQNAGKLCMSHECPVCLFRGKLLQLHLQSVAYNLRGILGRDDSRDARFANTVLTALCAKLYRLRPKQQLASRNITAN